MSGSYKRHAFKPTAYGNARRARRIPRWLVLMLTGIVLGSGGLLFLQKSYGPPRLTAEQSQQLQFDLNSSNMESQRLQTQLNQQAQELAEIHDNNEKLGKRLEQAAVTTTQQAADIKLFAQALPPDPRGTSPGIRAATFKNIDRTLSYDLLLMQDEGKTDLFTGEIELVVNGRYPNGKIVNIDLPRFPVALKQYTHTEGQIPLPDGLIARQVTIKVYEKNSTKLSATRTIKVQP